MSASNSDDPHEALPYHIELWDIPRKNVERLLGDALSAPVAQAIFQSALHEYPDRCITLRYGTRIMTRSDDIRASPMQ